MIDRRIVNITDKGAIYVNDNRITDRSTKWGQHSIIDSFECAREDVVKICLDKGYKSHVQNIDTDPYLSQRINGTGKDTPPTSAQPAADTEKAKNMNHEQTVEPGPFQVSKSSDGTSVWHSARDAAAGVSLPANSRDHAMEMISALNNSVQHHVRVATAQPADGRPMATDIFLAELLEACDDHYDLRIAVQDWVEGDWESAVQYIENDEQTIE